MNRNLILAHRAVRAGDEGAAAMSRQFLSTISRLALVLNVTAGSQWELNVTLLLNLLLTYFVSVAMISLSA